MNSHNLCFQSFNPMPSKPQSYAIEASILCCRNHKAIGCENGLPKGCFQWVIIQ